MQYFEAYLSVELQLGEVTIEGYLKLIKRFIKDTKCVFPTREIIIAYLAAMKKNQDSFSHIRNTSNGLQHFMNFRGFMDFKLKPPKRPKRVMKNVLSENEIEWMIRAAKNLKDRAFIVYLAYTGCRFKELKNTQVKHLDFKHNEVLIESGKGDKDRNICISPEALAIIKEYIEKYKRKEDDFLFHEHLSRKYVIRVLREVKEKVGITKKVHPHLFRHSLATNMLERGASLLTIQNQLGHSNLKSTLIYLNFNREVFKKQYDRYRPDYLAIKRIRMLPHAETYEIVDERGTIYSGSEKDMLKIWKHWKKHNDVDTRGHVKLVKVIGVKQDGDLTEADWFRAAKISTGSIG